MKMRAPSIITANLEPGFLDTDMNSSAQPLLFNLSAGNQLDIPGLAYIPTFIDADTEAALIATYLPCPGELSVRKWEGRGPLASLVAFS